LSALPVNGLIILFGIGGFQAVSGSGSFTVQSAAPLRGTLQAELQNSAGETRELSGELTVTRIGPGCG
jgi:hypothetical protein